MCCGRLRDSRVNLELVVIFGVCREEVGDAVHGTAERAPVVDAAHVLLLSGPHAAYTNTHAGHTQVTYTHTHTGCLSLKTEDNQSERDIQFLVPPILMTWTTM